MWYLPSRASTYAVALVLSAGFPLACASQREPPPSTERLSSSQVQALARAVIDHLRPESHDAGIPDAAVLRPIGEFELTYYWMAHEGESSEPRDVTLYTRRCEELVTVTSTFAARIALEGTGRLQDGRTINVAGDCDCVEAAPFPCFFAVPRDKRWGVGVAERPLDPYRSVAVDTDAIPIGTKLYIPALDGLTMPGGRPYGGFVHDGCVVADDTGSRVGHRQLDLFMVFKIHYEAFDRRHRLKRIEVYDGSERCGDTDREGVPAHRNAT